MISRELHTLILGFIFVLPATAFADGVYKWEDRNGVVHYSSKPVSADAKPAELPKIMRGEAKLASQPLVSCKEHGGINCQAGPDSDGSVICYDNFKEASPRYRFSCNSPKLEITDVSDWDAQGNFKVYVRNANAVAASVPTVLFKPENAPEVKLDGPGEVDPFGLAEFDFKKGDKQLALRGKVTIAQLTLNCANCP